MSVQIVSGVKKCLVSYLFACLSHFNVSESQTNLNIIQGEHK